MARLAFDLDNTLLDSHATMKKRAEALGLSIINPDDDKLGLDLRMFKWLHDEAIRCGDTARIQPFSEVLAILRELDGLGHELYYPTARRPYQKKRSLRHSIWRQTKECLKRLDFPQRENLRSVYTPHKAGFCAHFEFDVIIDDYPKVCREFVCLGGAAHRTKLYIRRQPWNQHLTSHPIIDSLADLREVEPQLWKPKLE